MSTHNFDGTHFPWVRGREVLTAVLRLRLIQEGDVIEETPYRAGSSAPVVWVLHEDSAQSVYAVYLDDRVEKYWQLTGWRPKRWTSG